MFVSIWCSSVIKSKNILKRTSGMSSWSRKYKKLVTNLSSSFQNWKKLNLSYFVAICLVKWRNLNIFLGKITVCLQSELIFFNIKQNFKCNWIYVTRNTIFIPKIMKALYLPYNYVLKVDINIIAKPIKCCIFDFVYL